MNSASLISKSALADIPDVLRKPLLLEYKRIIENYLEGNWIASELSGGRFCELVYAILDGYASGSYPATIPSKPKDFVGACRKLEQNVQVPRSFQILIPRLLPVLFEVRNNRDVGHVGGDVNSNFMDASAVVAMAKWTLAELIRVFHKMDVASAQKVADSLAERTLPILWKSTRLTRVMDSSLPLREQAILLLSGTQAEMKASDVADALDNENLAYMKKLLRELHKARLIEFDELRDATYITPKGSQAAEKIIGRVASL